MRSPITIAGIDGYARTDDSTCAQAESAERAHAYCGGPDDRSTCANMLRDNPNWRATCVIAYEPCSQQVNAQTFTVTTLPSSR